ncbi:MAG: DNA-directed RNA polymerase subunit delta [Allobaculum sp.]|nr:DNA-directed RNA polymerase subunit delta [Allobaculum sp.]
MKKSMIEIAYGELANQHKPMSFLDLWNIVSKEMGFNQSQANGNIAQFYSDLSMDGRFTALPGNIWDLRKRQSSAHTIVDTDSLSVEDEDDFLPEEEDDLDSYDSLDEDE